MVTEEDALIGRIVLAQKLITEEQLQTCLALQRKTKLSLAEIFLDERLVNEEQLKTIFAIKDKILRHRVDFAEVRQKDTLLGKIIVKHGYATQEQVDECLESQYKLATQGKFKRLGEIMAEKGYMSVEDVKKLLKYQNIVIMTCGKCNKTYNTISTGAPEYRCPHCNSILKPAQGSTISVEPTTSKGPDPLIGKRIGGCEIFELIGKGSMGNVYKARHIGLNKTVAVKVIPTLKRNLESVRRMVQEARSAAKLEHPNIMQVFNVGIEGEFCFIIMQLLVSRTLADVMKGPNPITFQQALKIAKSIALGLVVAHEKGIIHRDLKPDNIAITKDFDAKIMDFGLALDVEVTGIEKGVIVGTPHYIPPEQWLGHTTGAYSDLYSLGVILYYITTGRKPFDGAIINEIRDQHINKIPPSPSEVNSDIPQGVSAVIKKLMAKSPAKRYKSAAELIKDIEKIESGIEPDAMKDFADLITCRFCEALNPASAKRCKVCGEPISSEKETELRLVARKDEFECPKCGEYIRIGSRSCPGCGVQICIACKRKVAIIEGRCLACADTDTVKKRK